MVNIRAVVVVVVILAGSYNKGSGNGGSGIVAIKFTAQVGRRYSRFDGGSICVFEYYGCAKYGTRCDDGSCCTNLEFRLYGEHVNIPT